MECLSTCINSRCIKKAQSVAEVDPPSLFKQFIYTHAHTLACRDLLSGNKKRFCLATDTIKGLSSSGWTSARSPGHPQNMACPPADRALEMDGRVRVNELDGCCFFVRAERWGGGSCTVSEWRGPQTTAAPILTAREKEKRAPSVPPASGPPSLPQRVYQSPPPPSSRPLNPRLPSLPLPARCCLFSQAE